MVVPEARKSAEWEAGPRHRGHRNGAWGALCGVRPGACGVPRPSCNTRHDAAICLSRGLTGRGLAGGGDQADTERLARADADRILRRLKLGADQPGHGTRLLAKHVIHG